MCIRDRLKTVTRTFKFQFVTAAFKVQFDNIWHPVDVYKRQDFAKFFILSHGFSLFSSSLDASRSSAVNVHSLILSSRNSSESLGLQMCIRDSTSTAPAAVSLAVLASGFRSVVTKSTTDSIAVLTSSRAVSYTHLDVYKRQHQE